MKKLLFLICLLIPITTLALDLPDVNSKVVEIYDLTDKKVLYDVNANDVVSIASLTKIATTITALENIENLDEEVVITSEILNTVSWEAARAGLRAGDRLTYRDLLYASMLPSGADATNSLAILSSGSIDAFVEKMNNLASKLGLEHTHFVNVTGLDIEGHHSTADEVRRLLEYALENPTFREIYTTKEYTLSNGKVVKSSIFNYNRSNGINTDLILGGKTGFTLEAGYCLATLSNINGHEVLILVLKADKGNGVFYHVVDTGKLIDFMNANYRYEILFEKDQLVKEIPVKLSDIDMYSIYSKQDVIKYLPSDFDREKLEIKYDGADSLDFNNHEGDSIGIVSYYYDGELIIKQDVILDKKINLNIRKVIKKYLVYIIILGVILLFILILFIVFVVYGIKIKRKRKKNKKK